MTTIVQLVQQARFLLFGSSTRDRVNFLADDLSATGTALNLTLDAQDYAVGDYIESNFESMLVTAVSSNTLTVQRGMDGTVPASIIAGTLVRIRPIVTDYALFLDMQAELADLSSPHNGLYQVRTADLHVTNSANGYDLGLADATKLIKARTSDQTNDWWRPTGVSMETGHVDFTSGVAIFLRGLSGRLLRVWVQAPFGALTLTAAVETTGLATTAMDLLPIGAAYRTAIGREFARDIFESQGDTRRAGEVPPGAERQGLTPFVALRATRIAAEKARLDQLWRVERE